MPKKPSRKQVVEDLLDASLNFIVRNPPEGFNVVYFHICASSGRLEEAAQYLKEFNKTIP